MAYFPEYGLPEFCFHPAYWWVPIALHQSLFKSNFILSISPYFKTRKGTGTRPIAMKPSIEFPQPSPKASYILNPQRGRRAPATDLIMVLAASAEAANSSYASTRYTQMDMKQTKFPNELLVGSRQVISDG